jgi:hypothetical protein
MTPDELMLRATYVAASEFLGTWPDADETYLTSIATYSISE